MDSQVQFVFLSLEAWYFLSTFCWLSSSMLLGNSCAPAIVVLPAQAVRSQQWLAVRRSACKESTLPHPVH
jgi:hypothetical protein